MKVAPANLILRKLLSITIRITDNATATISEMRQTLRAVRTKFGLRHTALKFPLCGAAWSTLLVRAVFHE
jgi:hypothetical protein